MQTLCQKLCKIALTVSQNYQDSSDYQNKMVVTYQDMFCSTHTALYYEGNVLIAY